ncbi:LysR family transcriptional regulator [Streptomyces plumbiresistens]|uniref:LysR family transcriptional regulator n=1 Tax=Streptomyces plumbiresistens TaxID=511811 RepID=A0ABP7RHN2_9ACTN
MDLFVRTSWEVALTPAGEQLCHDARRLLAESQATLERARRADEAGRRLTVGFMLGTDMTAVVQRFTDRHPGVEVRFERLRWWNHGQALRDGRVDAGFVRLPVDSEGLSLLPLNTEPIVVALPAEHALAARGSVGIADLAGEAVLRYAEATPAWNAFWTVDPRPDGSRPRQGPVVHDMEEIVEYVRAGRGVVFLPAPVAAGYARDDIAYVPVGDIPPGQIVLAWQAAGRSPLIAALVDSARDSVRHGTGPR